jgi:ADP-ribose pyrophosphatase
MINPLDRYFELLDERPDFFANTGEAGEIKIITDRQQIESEQQKIQEQLRQQGNPENWIDIGVLAEDQWFYIIRDLVEFPNGKIGGYIRGINRKSQEEGGFNVVLMCAQNNKILMIKKYHHEGRNWSWEFPRGFGEPGLTAEENAQKELEEEIGTKASHLTLLNKLADQKGGTAVFYAEIGSEKELALDIGEGITNYRWVSQAELDELVALGKLKDWFSLWAYALRKQILAR